MAEIVLSPFLQVVFEKVADPILGRIADRHGFKGEIEKLRCTLSTVQAELEDAGERQVTENAVRIWLNELKDAAYDAADLLDELAYQSTIRSALTDQVRYLFPALEPYACTFKDVRDLKQIREKLDALTREGSRFNFRESFFGKRSDTVERRQTGSFVIESEIYGREEDKERVVDVLLSGSADKSKKHGAVSVIPIVGIGGLGKTTLAQLAYNDERVTEHFELKIWVCVSHDFDVRKLINAMIESINESKCNFNNMDRIQSQLQKSLRGRRYLLVLDDVWNDDPDEWDKLRTSLSSGSTGSKIIITTRSKKVASIMGTTSSYQLQGLSEDACWNLFRLRAFGQEEEEEEEHANLFPIGKQIIKKCGGVPLAAKTLGSLMRFKRDEREWLFVQESELWNVWEGENGILPALKLSYMHLPPHLKRCFTYCSIFPKNYEIKKEKLIHLWMAEGLIPVPPSHYPITEKSPEDIGNEYFNDLLWMLFFEDVKECDSGYSTVYKMHDLIHDLARSVCGNEFNILDYGRCTPRNCVRIRHSSLIGDVRWSVIPEALYEAKKLRTLILLYPRGDFGEVPPKLFTSLRFLRVLDLSGCGIKGVPESVSCLICLKYLDLSHTPIELLPETICTLHLQTLNLTGCCNLMELPGNMSKMFQLRHLNINGCDRLTCMPARIDALAKLMTLPMFIVGNDTEEGISQLAHLGLHGNLHIRHLENIETPEDSCRANLRAKPDLHSLGLSWRNNHAGLVVTNDDDSRLEAKVLERLQPHRNLKRLTVEGYAGTHFPVWLGNQLPNLTEIMLKNCRKCENLPTLGNLPFLKVLYMQGMDAVKNIGSEFHGEGTMRIFPSLKELTLVDFPYLEFWWWGMHGEEPFPSLTKLTINKCPRLVAMPPFPSLQHLELRNCNAMKVRSPANLSSLSILVIDGIAEPLVHLENLLQNNPLLMSLTISSCPKLYSISPKIGKLVALKSLTIRWCEELHSLPQELQNLISLETLEISECHSLICLPGEEIRGLSSLRYLSIENCSNLTSLPIDLKHLTALRHLIIMYCPNLTSLPEDLQQLSALQSLSILSCPGLATLPEGLQNVTTLQNLEIRSCPGLMALPESVQHLASLRSMAISDCHNLLYLPKSLECLNALQHLSVRESPELEKRCKDGGEDWQKIAHIPHVYIGSPEFRQHNTASSSSH